MPEPKGPKSNAQRAADARQRAKEKAWKPINTWVPTEAQRRQILDFAAQCRRLLTSPAKPQPLGPGPTIADIPTLEQIESVVKTLAENKQEIICQFIGILAAINEEETISRIKGRVESFKYYRNKPLNLLKGEKP